MKQELKIVISYQGGTIIVGMQRPDCDPVLTVMKGELEVAISSLKDLIVEAEAVWQRSPRYPQAELPAPPAATPVRATASQMAQAVPRKTTLQQHMF